MLASGSVQNDLTSLWASLPYVLSANSKSASVESGGGGDEVRNEGFFVSSGNGSQITSESGVRDGVVGSGNSTREV